MAEDKATKNRRIIKNVWYLYLRMIVTTVVSLYTARLVLELLGAENFGVFNVVGGVVGFVGILTGTMISATQRYLAYDLGRGDIIRFQKTFSMLLNIFIMFSAMALLLFELIGPYIILEKLNIPEGKREIALWIFQFSIVTFIISTIVIPYTSAIVAYEKMSIYAYFVILDVAFKLLVIFFLYVTPYDRLLTYGFLTLVFSVICNLIYFIYCIRKLPGCRYIKSWDTALCKEIAQYAGWNLFGSATGILNTQGLSILLNIFFGPIVNAAKAIADRINTTLVSFCNNFNTAVNPQIIKSYAEGDIDYTRDLVIRASKISFYLMSIISIPFICNMDSTLILWLGDKNVTTDMISFSQWILIYSVVLSLENPITQAVRATGNIKKYQVVIGIQTLLIIPICYVLFKLGLKAYTSMIVLTLVYYIAQFSRAYIVKPIINLKIKEYFKSVMFPTSFTFLSSLILIYCTNWAIQFDNLYVNLGIRYLYCFIVAGTIIICFGLTKNERHYIKMAIASKLKLKFSCHE